MTKNTIKTKEEVLNALEGEKVLHCPFCNHNVFTRKMRQLHRVQMIDDGETISDEDADNDYETEYEYECANCGKDVTNLELK